MSDNEQELSPYRKRRARGLKSVGMTMRDADYRRLKAQSELLGYHRPGEYVMKLVDDDAKRRGFRFGGDDDQEDHS